MNEFPQSSGHESVPGSLLFYYFFSLNIWFLGFLDFDPGSGRWSRLLFLHGFDLWTCYRKQYVRETSTFALFTIMRFRGKLVDIGCIQHFTRTLMFTKN